MRGLGIGLVVLLGCSPSGSSGSEDDSGTGTDGGTGSSSIPSTSSTTADGSTTQTSFQTGGGTGATTGAESSSGSSSSSSSGGSSSSSSTTGPDGLADGEECDNAAECASGACFNAGVLGGFCGECADDDDCMWGCNVANPFSEPPQGSDCGDGMLASGCEDDDACMAGLVCHQLFFVPGVISVAGCSECDEDADCAELCSPVIDDALTEANGHWECVTMGSVGLGGGCDLTGSGDAACASGACAAGSIMGVVDIGICSECDDDGDCAGTCNPPTVELDGTVTPGACA